MQVVYQGERFYESRLSFVYSILVVYFIREVMARSWVVTAKHDDR